VLSETEGGLLQVRKDIIDSEFNNVTGTIQVESDTSFFELGGNSLLPIKLQTLISIRLAVLFR